MRIEEPDACRFYACMLIERGDPGDRDRAHELLARAVDLYREFGMSAHESLACEMITR
jgi:hypothetical protein